MSAKNPRRGWWKYWLVYSGLALILVGPLLSRSYFVHVATVINPPGTGANTYLFYETLHLLNLSFSANFLEFLMFLILLFSGVGMHRLIDKKLRTKKIRRSTKSRLDVVRIYGKTKVLNELRSSPAIPAYFAGILYMVNPYTLERWMAGDFLLLAGYALLPWLLRSLFGFVNRPDWNGAFRLILYFTGMALLSFHMLIVASLAGIVAAIVYSIATAHKLQHASQILEASAFFILGFIVVNNFWLNGVVRGTTAISQLTDKVTTHHLTAFGLSMVSLPLLLILFSLFVVGVRRRLVDDRPQAVTILILALLGCLFASKANAPLLGSVNELIVLACAYFGAYGLRVLAEKVADKKDSIFIFMPTALLILPFALAPRMLF